VAAGEQYARLTGFGGAISLDSQFRCGKCAKPVSSKYTKCLDCGFLGPHTFNVSVGGALEGGPPVAHPPKRRDTYPAELVDKPQPPPVSRAPERFQPAEPVDVAEDMPRPHGSHEVDDDTRFPVGMRRRSPILDFVDNMDDSEDTEPKRRSKREDDRDSEDESDEDDRYISYDEDRREKPAPEKPDNTVTLIISIVLILLLAIAAIYVINNYDALTKWLASPTVPEVFKPSE
jgi:hypothetical protein